MKNNSGGWGPMDILLNVFRAWKLLLHPRVPANLKLFLPLLGFIYWLSPIDLLPMMPFDDIAVLMLALNLFVQQANSALDEEDEGVADEHYRDSVGDEDTIDTTWRVVE